MACKNCHRALKPGHEIEQPCSSCDEENPISIRCHIGVLVGDASATAYAEIYSPNAKRLIPFSTMQLKEVEEGGRLLTSKLESALENKHVVCYMRCFDILIQGAE